MDTSVQPVTVPTAAATTALSPVPTGTQLEPGGVYLDLARPERGPFVALSGQVAGRGDRYVARRDLGCRQWWRLVTANAHAVVPVADFRHPSRSGGTGAGRRFAGAPLVTAAP